MHLECECLQMSNLTREMVDPAIYTNNDNEDCIRQMANRPSRKLYPAKQTCLKFSLLTDTK